MKRPLPGLEQEWSVILGGRSLIDADMTKAQKCSTKQLIGKDRLKELAMGSRAFGLLVQQLQVSSGAGLVQLH